MNSVKVNDAPMKKPSPAKKAKAAAKLAITEHRTRLTLIFSLMICGAAMILVFIASTSFTYAFAVMTGEAAPDAVYNLIDTISILPVFFITAPLCLGFYRMAVRAAYGESIGISETFRYFSSFTLAAKSWLVGIIAAFPVFFAVAAYYFASFIPDGGASKLVRYALIPAAVLLLCVPNVLSMPTSYAFVCSDDANPLKCFTASVKASSGNFWRIVALRLGFLPLMLLSFCTIGVLFLIYTIPYMTVAEIYFSEYLLTGDFKKLTTEDKIHE